MPNKSNPSSNAGIFEEKTLRMRQARAKRNYEKNPDKSPDFLMRFAADEIAARLSLVSREFAHAVGIFGRTGALASEILTVQNVKKIARIEESDFVTDDAQFDIAIAQPNILNPKGPLENEYDLAISAFSLHWSADLPGALIQIRNILQPDGLFLGILPGPDTLSELRECLAMAEAEIAGGLSPRIDPFITVQTAGALMQRAGFALPVIDSDKITVRYDTMFDLIRDLRAMAATNCLRTREKGNASRFLFVRAAEIYASRFADTDGRIRATFELISMSGWVPHHSQQQPLKPGSATTQLADALKGSK